MKRNRYLMAGAVILAATASIAQTSVIRQNWGKTSDGHTVQIFTLADHDLKVKITSYGSRIVSIEAPERSGKMADVVLGYDSAVQYEADKSTYFGAIVGRYGNRIAMARFRLMARRITFPSMKKRMHCTAVLSASTNSFGPVMRFPMGLR